MKTLTLVFALACSACSQVLVPQDAALRPGESTVKIQAISASGRQSLGSGVVVAANKIATNCHVTRAAKRVYVTQPERLYPVLKQAVLPELDVCILETERLALSAVTLTDEVTLGEDIVLAGYPFALNLRVAKGKVVGLHPYGDSQLIEISGSFTHGASGGGVFNQQGELVGLMTFMGPEAGVIHYYVIPATWLMAGLEQEFVPFKPFGQRSFWEKGQFVKSSQK